MTSMENIEVYIPKEAHVRNIPFRSLSSSMVRKISAHLGQNRSETLEKQIVTCISPVELREKAMADSSEVKKSCMTKITPGQFWLPVVSSSAKAYKVLKNILPAHKPPIQLSVPEREDSSCSISKDSFQNNSFIVFKNQIFLSVKKSRGRRVSSQNVTSSSAFPVVLSRQHQEDAPPSCQTQDTPRPQQSTTRGQTVVKDARSSALLQKVSEVTPEQHYMSKEGQKDAETTSDSANSPPKPPQTAFSLQTSNSEPNILHLSQEDEPTISGGEGETQEHLDNAGILPMVGSCLAFDFQLLAKEEKISNLRARLKQKEAALSILKSKPTDQV